MLSLKRWTLAEKETTPAGNYMFKVHIASLEQGVKYVQS